MTQPYQLLNDTETVLRVVDSAHIPNDPANRDRQEYDQWIADGGVPDPAPPVPTGVVTETVQATALARARDDNAHGKTKEAVDSMLDWMERRTGTASPDVRPT